MKRVFLIAFASTSFLFTNAQNLQTVTDNGNTTTQNITIHGLESTAGFARFYSNGSMNSFVGSDHSAFGQGGQDGVFYVYGANKFHVATGNIRRFTVDGIGNVGIGTVNPKSKLDVNDWISTLSISSNKHTEAMSDNEVIGGINFYKHYSIGYAAAIKLLQAGAGAY